MELINIEEIRQFVQNHIGAFHQSRLKSLNETNLMDLLKKKNPYLFKAKYMITAQELVTGFLDAKLSSSEEELFGNFLEDLAIFVAEKTLNAIKSSATGLDLEYTKGKTRYVFY